MVHPPICRLCRLCMHGFFYSREIMKSGLAAEHVVEVEDKYTDTVVAYGVKNKKSITQKHYY